MVAERLCTTAHVERRASPSESAPEPPNDRFGSILVEKLLAGHRPKLLTTSGGSRARGAEGVATFHDVRPWSLVFRLRARDSSILDRMRVRRRNRRCSEKEFFNGIGQKRTVTLPARRRQRSATSERRQTTVDLPKPGRDLARSSP